MTKASRQNWKRAAAIAGAVVFGIPASSAFAQSLGPYDGTYQGVPGSIVWPYRAIDPNLSNGCVSGAELNGKTPTPLTIVNNQLSFSALRAPFTYTGTVNPDGSFTARLQTDYAYQFSGRIVNGSVVASGGAANANCGARSLKWQRTSLPTPAPAG